MSPPPAPAHAGLDRLTALARACALAPACDRFFFLRHGQTGRNAARIFQGPDEPLSETGIAQAERAALRLWSWIAARPALYGASMRVVARLLRIWGGRERRIRRLPPGGGWTAGRDLPAPDGRTFREQYAARRRAGGKPR